MFDNVRYNEICTKIARSLEYIIEFRITISFCWRKMAPQNVMLLGFRDTNDVDIGNIFPARPDNQGDFYRTCVSGALM